MKLFTPFNIGGLQTLNRIVFAPIGCNLAKDEGFVSDKNLRHYEERAKGGAGIIIVEATSVAPIMSPTRTLGIWDNKHIPGLTKLSDRIRKHRSKSFIQIFHLGPKARSKEQAVSSSKVPVGGFIPRTLDADEVYNVIGDFVEAGVRAWKSRFDGVELHGAHFCLLSAFLSPHTNTRQDEFGGDTNRRSKIVCDIINGIKKRVGEGFPVICRINAVERLVRGMTIEESKEISILLEAAGADAIHVSAYDRPLNINHSSKGISVDGLGKKDDPKGTFVKYASEIKNAVEVPVITVSKLDDPLYANEVLENDKADLIAIGRGLLADPHLPKKAQEGRFEAIDRCTYCNVCRTYQKTGKEIRCSVNSELGF